MFRRRGVQRKRGLPSGSMLRHKASNQSIRRRSGTGELHFEENLGHPTNNGKPRYQRNAYTSRNPLRTHDNKGLQK